MEVLRWCTSDQGKEVELGAQGEQCSSQNRSRGKNSCQQG